MIPPIVVNKYKETFDIEITRPSLWGNPFIIGIDGTRKEVIEKYKQRLLQNPVLIEALYNLSGLKLGCVCKPKPCHGDVLVELFNLLYSK